MFTVNVSDPIKKREEFAVNLRKQKTRQIVEAKRMRYAVKTISLPSSTPADSTNDQTSPSYTGFTGFIEDEGFYMQFLVEIAPEWCKKQDELSVSQTFCGT